MGCFLGCFGFSGRRRRWKPANKVLPGDHRVESYEPLDSTVSQLSWSDKKIKEISSIKIGKKMSFNLNVQTYEPLKDDETVYWLSKSDEDEMREKNCERFANGSLSTTVSEEKSTESKMGPFPSNHRYQNCRDSYDDEEDEDDMAHIGSDLDEDDDVDDEFEYDYDNENDIDYQRISQSEFLKQPNNQSVESLFFLFFYFSLFFFLSHLSQIIYIYFYSIILFHHSHFIFDSYLLLILHHYWWLIHLKSVHDLMANLPTLWGFEPMTNHFALIIFIMWISILVCLF